MEGTDCWVGARALEGNGNGVGFLDKGKIKLEAIHNGTGSGVAWWGEGFDRGGWRWHCVVKGRG